MIKSLLFWLLLVLCTPGRAEDLPVTAPFFAATLGDLEDKPVALERYRGKPLIVNFWARWCGPCRQEIPELLRIRAAHKGRLEVIGIALEDRAESVREFARAYDMDYPILLAREQGIPLMQLLGNSKAGLPFTVMIDREGRMLGRRMGILKKADLDAAAEALLKK